MIFIKKTRAVEEKTGGRGGVGGGWGGGGDWRGRTTPLFLGAICIHFLYKVLGERSV